jgi:hypothetical protein
MMAKPLIALAMEPEGMSPVHSFGTPKTVWYLNCTGRSKKITSQRKDTLPTERTNRRS